jgi:nucleotide-binding universal stress UspA family protein/predicted transcriptional regulator
MQKTILVPLDGSSAAEGVLPWAIEMGRARHHSVTLAQVLRWPPFPMYPDGAWIGAAALYDEILDGVRQTATEYLTSVRERWAGKGVPIKLATGQGQISETILGLADECAASTIAMSMHDQGGMRHLLLGSIAEQVAHRAAVPVLLFHAAEQRVQPASLRRLLVPLDGSAFGESALDLARDVAGADTALILVDVARVVLPALSPSGNGESDRTALELADRATDRNVEAARAYLDRAAQALSADGYWVETWTRVGIEWNEIVEVAHEADADLIVVASHERSGPARWMHSSVANAVIRHADVPVLLAGPRALVEHAIGSLLVEDVIVPTRTRIRQDDSLESAVRLLNRHGMSGAPVVDEAGHLVGLLSAADLVSWEARLVGRLAKAANPNAASYAEHLAGETVETVMERPPATVQAGTPLVEVFDLLRQQRSGLLVVTHKRRPVGILTSADVVRLMAGSFTITGHRPASPLMSA